MLSLLNHARIVSHSTALNQLIEELSSNPEFSSYIRELQQIDAFIKETADETLYDDFKANFDKLINEMHSFPEHIKLMLQTHINNQISYIDTLHDIYYLTLAIDEGEIKDITKICNRLAQRFQCDSKDVLKQPIFQKTENMLSLTGNIGIKTLLESYGAVLKSQTSLVEASTSQPLPAPSVALSRWAQEVSADRLPSLPNTSPLLECKLVLKP